jgi:hypothetical protein
MVKARIRISKELAIRSVLRPIGHWHGIRTYVPFHGWRVCIFALVVIVLDAVTPSAKHMAYFGYSAFAYIGFCAIFDYARWIREVRATTAGYEYAAELSDEGATVVWPERRETTPWSEYLDWRDCGDAIELRHRDGGISYVPKSAETDAAVEFTKSKLPMRPAPSETRDPMAVAAPLSRDRRTRAMTPAVRFGSRLLALAVLVAVAGCGGARESGYVLDRLYFGLGKPDGAVTDEQFQAFVDDQVTPRFPDGLTRFQAQGQWKNASGQIIRERSVVIELAFKDSAENQQKIRDIVAEYCHRFTQESVMVVEAAPSVRF